ncbi:hypothetical protein BDV32DRAFT_78438 [Aspergillus pseudonomiae]|nr:hypothetical protein BDV32DRAFT_78438 [Aspergillus pseudonomiae]
MSTTGDSLHLGATVPVLITGSGHQFQCAGIIMTVMAMDAGRLPVPVLMIIHLHVDPMKTPMMSARRRRLLGMRIPICHKGPTDALEVPHGVNMCPMTAVVTALTRNPPKFKGKVYRLFTLREVWICINRITGATVMESLTDEIRKHLRGAQTGVADDQLQPGFT